MRKTIICLKIIGFLILSGSILLSCTEDTAYIDTTLTEQVVPFSTASLTAEAGAMQTVQVGDKVKLSANNLSDGNLFYHWVFKRIPENSQAIITGFESQKPSFIADQAGSYVVQLHVIDANGQIAKDIVAIHALIDINAKSQASARFHISNLSCVNCHDGKSATGRAANHISASNECALCHSGVYWVPLINVDHREVIGTCSSCHNGIVALTKSDIHIKTTQECNECHNPGVTFNIYQTSSLARDHRSQFGSFLGTRITNNLGGAIQINSDDDDDDSDSDDDNDEGSGSAINADHPNVNGRLCTECHTQPADHFPTTDNCQACHTTANWDLIITVDHAEVIGGCDSCHRKPVNHIPTTSQCNACHGTTNWLPVAGGLNGFDHSTLTAGTRCDSCHNNTTVVGKSPTHIESSNNCEACHVTSGFVPVVSVNHNDVIGVCSTCHDGVIATGKTPNHIITNSECDVCHTTSSFVIIGGLPATIDHTTFTAATVCADCHNGTTASGKTPTHIITTSDCDICHTTTSFVITGGLPTAVDHTTFIAATVCTDCHNGTIATGKTATHMITANDCDVCHTTSSFVIAGGFPATIDHRSFTLDTVCTDCHNGITATGKTPTHITTSSDCDVCHATNSFLILGTTPAAIFDHTNISNGTTCSSCHNGVTATGKSPTHIFTLADCNVCHNSNAFIPTLTDLNIAFDHGTLSTNALCRDCHTRPTPHVITIKDCSACHITNSWVYSN